MYKLVIADDEGKTTVVPLVRDEITIGRKEGNTIRLTERNISRRHARLRKANGAYVVEDLQSYNGVKVNGRRIGGEVALKAGDQITIGDYQLSLQLDETATTAETTGPTAMPAGAEAATALLQAPAAGPALAPALAAQPPARLVMVSPPAPGAEFALARPVTRLGRAEELDIWINHRSISREHAEIENENGRIRIRDLGSANGIRVNGREVTQADLAPGDVVELGQVRFRFVAPGETFVFDAARTMQLEAVSAPQRPAARAPLLAAAGIVGLAVAGAVAVAMTGGEEPETAVVPLPTAAGPATALQPPAPPQPAPMPGAGVESHVAAAIAACRTAINGGDFAGAVARAEEALRLRPGDPDASSCRHDAERAQHESETFARGDAARRAGQIERAYLEFESLPPDSPYRLRTEVTSTMREFATLQIERANAVLGTDPEEAFRYADSVRAMATVDASLRRQADAIARRARQRAGGGGAVAAKVGPGREPERRPDPRGTTLAGTAGRPETPSSARPESSAGVGAVAPATDASGQSPLQQAQTCLARGDNPCVIRALEGRARTAQEFRLLIETYRAIGNTPRMLDSMERFIQRFPTDPRAGAYRQTLASHGR